MKNYILAIFCVFSFLHSKGQECDYDRSALTTILIETDKFINYDAVMDAWNKFPCPDQYDEHTIRTKSVKVYSPEDVVLNDEILLENGFLQDTIEGKMKLMFKPYVKYLNADSSLGVILPRPSDSAQLQNTIAWNKTLAENKITNQVLASWLGMLRVDSNGQVYEGEATAEIIFQRSRNNMTMAEAKEFAVQELTMDKINDQGWELIENSFVTFTSPNIYENEPAAALIRDAALESINAAEDMNPIAKEVAIEAAHAAYDVGKEGYTMVTNTSLLKLNFHKPEDETMEDFLNRELVDHIQKGTIDIFNDDISNIVTLDYQSSFSQPSIILFNFQGKSESEMITKIFNKNMGKSFLALQRKNDVFKPFIRIEERKDPVTGDPVYTIPMGTKEGLEGGEKFEVFDCDGAELVPSKGSASAMKEVWDNLSFSISEEVLEKGEELYTVLKTKKFKSGIPRFVRIK